MEGIRWALRTFDATNWHPLTWLFMLAEYDIFGLNPAGYHVVGTALHITNAILLFVIMLQITGGQWKAITVAALFSVHPMNLESVIWIAEQKSLLSTLFGFLTILCYLRYVEKPRLTIYLAAILLYAPGLMAKPMPVTLPVLLLLLDYWPLERLHPATHPIDGHAGTQWKRKVSGLRAFLPVIMVLPIFYCMIVTSFELPHWQDTEAVFTRAVKVTTNNYLALLGLGNLYRERGDLQAAEQKFREAIRIKADYTEAHNNLAVLLMQSNRPIEAEYHLREAIRHTPFATKAHNNLGALLAEQGKLEEAKVCFEKALELNPNYAEALANLSRLNETARHSAKSIPPK